MIKILNGKLKFKILLFVMILCNLTFTSCSKSTPISEKFVGTFRVIKRFPTTEINQISTISAGEEDNLINWEIEGKICKMEIFGTSPKNAHSIGFSAPIFLDDSASLTWIDKDTIEGSISLGSIFFGYKHQSYFLVR